MSSFRIRPTFSQTVVTDLAGTRAKVLNALTGGQKFEIKDFPGFICIRICPEDRHYWSPRLNLSLEELPGGHTRVDGTYGPNANVWSAFLYAYLITGLLATFSGIFGLCQWHLGEPPWGLWIFGAMLAIAASLYLLAQFGQKLAAQQMFQIHLAYESAIGNSVIIN